MTDLVRVSEHAANAQDADHRRRRPVDEPKVDPVVMQVARRLARAQAPTRPAGLGRALGR